MVSVKSILSTASGPLVGIILGSILGATITLNPKIISGLRAFAAGIILAAVSLELGPEIADVDGWKNRLGIIIGIILGMGTLILLRTIMDKHNAKGVQTKDGEVPWDMYVSIAIDFFIDAIMIGMAMATIGTGAGLVLGISLGIEMFLVTATLSETMKLTGVSKLKIGLIAGSLAVVVIGGGLLGYLVGRKIKGKPGYFGMISFGVAALLWLVIEELLVETKKDRIDPRLQATLILGGFLAVLAGGWLAPHGHGDSHAEIGHVHSHVEIGHVHSHVEIGHVHPH